MKWKASPMACADDAQAEAVASVGPCRPCAIDSRLAGALGMPQFMPSEFYKHAYDLDGDGKKDIWTSVPDALASPGVAVYRAT